MIRRGIDSRCSTFDPLQLAADWFFCNNLACRRAVFDDVPLSPYDHSRGFGAEDWHWSAETLAAGYHHVTLTGTAYFYRVKPKQFSLGRAGEFIPQSSSLFRSKALAGRLAHEQTSDELVTLSTESSRESEALPATFFQEVMKLGQYETELTWPLDKQDNHNKIFFFYPSVERSVIDVYRNVLFQRKEDEDLVVILADVRLIPGGISTLLRFSNLCGLNCGGQVIILVDGSLRK